MTISSPFKFIRLAMATVLVLSAVAIGAWAATPKKQSVIPAVPINSSKTTMQLEKSSPKSTTTSPSTAGSAARAVQPTPTPVASGSLETRQQQTATARMVKIMVDSGTAKATVLQTKLIYPADKLEYVSISEGNAFGVMLATDTSLPGVIRLARGTELGSEGVSGKFEVATVTFKIVPGSSGPAPVTVDLAGSMLLGSAGNLLAAGRASLTIEQ